MSTERRDEPQYGNLSFTICDVASLVLLVLHTRCVSFNFASAEFRSYFEHVNGLGFKHLPDYALLKRQFRALFIRSGFEYYHGFDWAQEQSHGDSDGGISAGDAVASADTTAGSAQSGSETNLPDDQEQAQERDAPEDRRAGMQFGGRQESHSGGVTGRGTHSQRQQSVKENSRDMSVSSQQRLEDASGNACVCCAWMLALPLDL